MDFKVYNVQNYDNGILKCITNKETGGLGGTTETPVNCVFVPDKNYPDFSKIQVTMTGSTWFDNYDTFVPKFERLFVDLIFIVLFFWFMIGLFRLVKKMFF